MVKVTAAGGVIHCKQADKEQVLLIYRNGLWDLPKGKKEKDESIATCARREVAEETGIPLPEIEAFLTKTRHQYEREGILHDKTTHWFAMYSNATDAFTPQKSEGIEIVQWVGLEGALKKVGYANLREVLKAFRQRV